MKPRRKRRFPAFFMKKRSAKGVPNYAKFKDTPNAVGASGVRSTVPRLKESGGHAPHCCYASSKAVSLLPQQGERSITIAAILSWGSTSPSLP